MNRLRKLSSSTPLVPGKPEEFRQINNLSPIEMSPLNDVAAKKIKKATVLDMVIEAIETIGLPRKGASYQAIKKWIIANREDVDSVRLKYLLKVALKKGVDEGILVKPQKTAAMAGVIGSFMLPKTKPPKISKTSSKKSAMPLKKTRMSLKTSKATSKIKTGKKTIEKLKKSTENKNVASSSAKLTKKPVAEKKTTPTTQQKAKVDKKIVVMANSKDKTGKKTVAKVLSKSEAGKKPAAKVASRSVAGRKPAAKVHSKSASETKPAAKAPLKGKAGKRAAAKVPSNSEAGEKPATEIPLKTAAGKKPANKVPLKTEAGKKPATKVPLKTEAGKKGFANVPSNSEAGKKPATKVPLKIEVGKKRKEKMPSKDKGAQLNGNIDSHSDSEGKYLFSDSGEDVMNEDVISKAAEENSEHPAKNTTVTVTEKKLKEEPATKDKKRRVVKPTKNLKSPDKTVFQTNADKKVASKKLYDSTEAEILRQELSDTEVNFKSKRINVLKSCSSDTELEVSKNEEKRTKREVKRLPIRATRNTSKA